MSEVLAPAFSPMALTLICFAISPANPTLSPHLGVGVATDWTAQKYNGIHTLAASSRPRRSCVARVQLSLSGRNHCQHDQRMILRMVIKL